MKWEFHKHLRTVTKLKIVLPIFKALLQDILRKGSENRKLSKKGRKKLLEEK